MEGLHGIRFPQDDFPELFAFLGLLPSAQIFAISFTKCQYSMARSTSLLVGCRDKDDADPGGWVVSQ
jgi:hypothetical protein